MTSHLKSSKTHSDSRSQTTDSPSVRATKYAQSHTYTTSNRPAHEVGEHHAHHEHSMYEHHHHDDEHNQEGYGVHYHDHAHHAHHHLHGNEYNTHHHHHNGEHHHHHHHDHDGHHGQHHHVKVTQDSVKPLQIAVALNLGFAFIEFIGGRMFNSNAIMSDAIHDFGDGLILLFSILIHYVSKRPANQRFTYGYRRLALVGAVLNSVILLNGTFYIFSSAWHSLWTVEPVVSTGMFWLSLIGIGANLYAALELHGTNNILNRSVFAHLLEDLLGWVAVALASIVMYFTNWYWLDAVLSFVIGGIVLRNVCQNLGTCYRMLMQAAPNQQQLDTLIELIKALDSVDSIQNYHYWTLDGEEQVFTAKITTNTTIADCSKAVYAVLADYPIVDITLEITPSEH